MSINQNSAIFDAIDDVFNLAFWMTGNEATAGLLVSQTYLKVNSDTTMPLLYKSFRESYLKSFGQTTVTPLQDINEIADNQIARAISTLPADFKMAVLFADLIRLSHKDISMIVEKPVETVREWIHWGRKFISKEVALQLQG